MTVPAIITVAITGSVPTKKDNPAVPIEPGEQIGSTHEAFEAGASVVHIHVRDEDGKSASDVDRFARVQQGVVEHCPGMIVQFSAGTRGRRASERGRSLVLRPDMATLATGSVNFSTYIYGNPPELIDELARMIIDNNIKPEIEVSDLAMLYNANTLAGRGLLKRPLHVQFVLGMRNALPAEEPVLDLMIGELKRVMPEATWGCSGVARHQTMAIRWALAKGGHPRTGLEDSIYLSKGVLAKSNAELVAVTAELCAEYGRHPASPAEARNILGLAAA